MTISKWAGVCLIAAILRSAAAADLSATIDIRATGDFYAPLSGVGAWINVSHYGRCWHPVGVAADWRPYCEGQWVWTDCGWYWQSDEPWAWACYHYGNWGVDPEIGWYWVPGIEWSPAWVTWRTGGGYIGWAPIEPGGAVLAPNFFAFVAIGHFGDPVRPSAVVLNDPRIISKTAVMRSVKHETHDIGGGRGRQITINEGPPPAEVEKATQRKFVAAPIAEAVRRSPPPRATSAPSKSVAPTVTPAPGTQSRPMTPAQPAPPARSDSPKEPERPIRPETPVNPIKPEKPENPGKPVTPAKPQIPKKPEEIPHTSWLMDGYSMMAMANPGRPATYCRT